MTLKNTITLATAFSLVGVSAAKAAYSDVILADSPACYYQLNEVSGTTAADSSGNGLNGTYTNLNSGSFPQLGLPWITSDATAAGFNGDGTAPSSVVFPYQSAFSSGTFSAECWAQANTTSVGDYCSVMAVFGSYGDAGTPDSSGWTFYETATDGSGNSYWSILMRPSPFPTATNPIVAGQWYHLAATFDGTTATLYVNGQVEATDTPDGGYIPDNSHDGSIGAQPRTGHAAFNGQVAQVAVYSSVLTPAQILAHYQAAAGTNTTSTGSLTIAPDGTGNVVITWPNGTLLSATNVTGSYSPVGGATSPYTNAPSGVSMFYRFSVP